MDSKYDADKSPRKEWTTPRLKVYGDVEKITAMSTSPPPKVFGGSDGATWAQQDVGWGS